LFAFTHSSVTSAIGCGLPCSRPLQRPLVVRDLLIDTGRPVLRLVEKVELEFAPVGLMDARQRVEPAVDDSRPYRRGRRVEEPARLRVRRVVGRDVAFDLSHHEERRAEHRLVVLVPVRRRQRHVGVLRQRLHHPVLRIEVGLEEDRV
jgi:hypothetical protein